MQENCNCHCDADLCGVQIQRTDIHPPLTGHETEGLTIDFVRISPLGEEDCICIAARLMLNQRVCLELRDQLLRQFPLSAFPAVP